MADRAPTADAAVGRGDGMGTVVFMRRWLVAPVVALASILAACGGSGSSSSAPTPASAAQTVKARPAGPNPSVSAQMVCGAEVRKELAGLIGLTPTRVTQPTWVDHVYSCTYVYPNGTMTLSVKELDSARQTQSYFDQLATKLGRPDPATAGQSAFAAPNGSVIARKDWKVLLVDASKLPAAFGQPPVPRGDLTGAVVGTILGCWTGA